MFIKKQSGIATVFLLALVATSFGVGMYFKHYTDHVDHPAEQMAENILDDYGVDVDFSKDKKAAQK